MVPPGEDRVMGLEAERRKEVGDRLMGEVLRLGFLVIAASREEFKLTEWNPLWRDGP